MKCICESCGGISRRSVIAGLACVAVASAATLLEAATQSKAEDERYMRIALEEARKADFPFGAVIVRDGVILARGGNLGRTNRDPTAHGEMVAIRNCVAEHGGRAMRGATLYTTGEPCVMCMGAILWSHFGRMVFAASIAQLATRMNQIMLTSADIAAKASFAPIEITGGVLADEAMALFAKK
jgi:tRNA(Arg) A34 adenosine deaminase TadA